MLTATNHRQQRTSDREGLGAALTGGCDRSSSGAFNKHQDRPALPLRRRAGCLLLTTGRCAARMMDLPVELGRAFGLGHFSRRLIGSRTQFHFLTQPSRQAIADVKHRCGPFVESRSNAPEHEPKGVGSAQEVVGVYQHDHC